MQVGLQLHPQQIVVGGPPWNTVVCTRFSDQATDARGEVIYRNEGVLVDRLVWGRIVEHVSYEDTQRTVAFDSRLTLLPSSARATVGHQWRSSMPARRGTARRR
jgi:hypothetical protein